MSNDKDLQEMQWRLRIAQCEQRIASWDRYRTYCLADGELKEYDEASVMHLLWTCELEHVAKQYVFPRPYGVVDAESKRSRP